MENINNTPLILTTVAGATDFLNHGGVIYLKGDSGQSQSIPKSGVRRVKTIGTTVGLPRPVTITRTNALAADTSYTGTIFQPGKGRNYSADFRVDVGATVPASDAAFYALVAAAINTENLLGVVTSSGSGVVFTPTVDAPIARVTVDANLTAASADKALTAAGSSATNAAPRVLTSGAAHGLTVGKQYLIGFSGVTGAGAGDLNNKAIYGIALNTTDITLLGTSATGAVVTTSATMSVLQSAGADFSENLTGVTGYVEGGTFVGLLIQFEGDAAMEGGSVINQFWLLNAGGNTVANINAALVEAYSAANLGAFAS